MSKLLKKIGRLIFRIFEVIFRIIDRLIVMPIIRLVYNLTKALSGNNSNFNKLLNRPQFLIVLSLIFSVICFLLIDNKVINAFLSMPDSYRFTRGIFSYVGFKKYCLEFEFVQREKGKSKWNFVKLLKYGVSGLNQFSTFFLSVPVIASIMCFLVKSS